MTFRQRRRAVFACLVVLLVGASTEAFADRIDRLNQILLSDPSYKVRLQVAITLGRIKAKRGVPALIKALSKDSNHTVRGVVAASLGQIGDSRAVAPLRTRLTRESNTFVKRQIAKALKNLGGTSATSATSNAILITVGKTANKSGKGNNGLAAVLADALLDEFRHVSGVQVVKKSAAPSAATLRRSKRKAFVLDGSVESISQRNVGGGVQISCKIKVALATYPENSMKAFYNGGATMAVSSGSVDGGEAMALYRELVRGAARGARQHIAQSYLSQQ